MNTRKLLESLQQVREYTTKQSNAAHGASGVRAMSRPIVGKLINISSFFIAGMTGIFLGSIPGVIRRNKLEKQEQSVLKKIPQYKQDLMPLMSPEELNSLIIEENMSRSRRY